MAQYKIASKPAGSDYGYKRGWTLVGCSREELIAQCASTNLPLIRSVWTPETVGRVPPATVDFLRPALHQREIALNGEAGCMWTFALIGWSFLLLVTMNFKDGKMFRIYLIMWAGALINLIVAKWKKKRLQRSAPQTLPDTPTGQ